MVGGGRARARRPKFEGDGAKYVSDVWESGSQRDFARSDRIPRLLEENHPDLVLLSLGANDVYEPKPEVMAPYIAKIAKMTQGTDCIWIGPPIWKDAYKRIVPVIRENAAPCIFFDSSEIEMHRKPDGIHPDERGGETYADAFWAFYRPPK
jgi:lysophospholipase L1-like esterase